MGNELKSPQVFNKHHAINRPVNCVYIGRGSKWGNPYVIGVDGDREQVIEKYKNYLFANKALLNEVKTELQGKNLMCFCSPLACHGDVLLQIANGTLQGVNAHE